MKSLKGSLLIAAPGLSDPNFVRTVVFIAEHNDEGALGLVLNRPGKTKVSELWAAISDEPSNTSACAFVGGPVQKNAVLLLHGHPDIVPAGDEIIPGVYLGGEIELLSELLKRENVPEGAARFRVFCGYSGWGAGQLEGEMKAGGWLTCPGSAEHVFDIAPETLWQKTLKTIGGVYEFFSLMPPDPELN